MRFVAIDVETANADMASICQIGIAVFDRGELIDEWTTYVDPEDYFDSMNVSIHGIGPKDIEGQPTFPNVMGTVKSFLNDTVTVCHMPFDRTALLRSSQKYGLPPISTQWLDSARVARRTWNEFATKGYGLRSVCERIGYEFQHHDALEDAKAAGQIILAAVRETNHDIEYWLKRVSQPIHLGVGSGGAHPATVNREGNPEGDLFGEVIVFTGSLAVPRQIAADLAASIGCFVEPSVTKRTTILVVGDQDIYKLAGHEKSSKHRKAEELASKGQQIRIIRESDFQELVAPSN